MKATFENSVNVLVRAYFYGTLEKDNCYACACGNLVASACGFSYKKNPSESSRERRKRIIWSHTERYYYDVTPDGLELPEWYDLVVNRIDEGNARLQVSSTGYSLKDFQAIERAFESGIDDFDGLMKVVDVLAEIHSVDLTIKESAKLLFVKS